MNRILLSTGAPLEKEAGSSRAVIKDNWAFVAGISGNDYVTMKMRPDIRSQTRNCLETIRQQHNPCYIICKKNCSPL